MLLIVCRTMSEIFAPSALCMVEGVALVYLETVKPLFEAVIFYFKVLLEAKSLRTVCF